jgi:hypothetical protein
MKQKTLGERWKACLSVVFDPWNALLILIALALFAISAYDSSLSKLTTALLSVLLTVAAAVLGARVTQQWSAITEQSVVQARGVAAVRSLKLLLRNIAALENRVSGFRAHETHITKHTEVTKRNYEEIRAACIVLQEEAVSSIENWTDIVEEADVRTQIGVITSLKADLEAKATELEAAKVELTKTEGRSVEESRRLQAHIEQVQSRVAELQRELIEKSIGVSGGLAIGTNTLSSIFGAAGQTSPLFVRNNPDFGTSILDLTSPARPVPLTIIPPTEEESNR